MQVVQGWHCVFVVPVQPPVVKDPLTHDEQVVHVCVAVLAYVPLGHVDTQAPLERYEPEGHDVHDCAEPAEQVRQEMSQGWQVLVWTLPYWPSPQLGTHDNPFRNKPEGQDVHCEAEPVHVAQDALQLVQNKLVFAEQMPVRYWFEAQADGEVHGTHDGVLWPLQVPESVWPGGQVLTQAAQTRLEESEQGLVSY